MPARDLRKVRTTWLLCGTLAFGQAQAVHQYTVRVDQALERFQVRACLDEPLPSALVALAQEASGYLERVAVPLSSGGMRPGVRGDRILLDGLRPGDCLEYSLSLPHTFRGGWRAPAQRFGDSLILSPRLWLWYPYRGETQQPFRLTFELPPGTEVSAPWPRSQEGDGAIAYRLGARPYTWPALIALGPLFQEELAVAGANLQLAVLPGKPPVNVAAFSNWIREGAAAVAALYGRFPVPNAQILVVPTGQGDEPVPWGQVMRGGGDAMHLFVDQRQPMDAFRRDWTLMHELSHLLHPRIDHDAPWLNEGLASYYQNVLRASSGIVSSEQAWEELDAGFRRGMQDTRPRETLAKVGENMRRNRRFMRVYWSGAAIALLADVELRQRSGGRRSLAGALQGFNECCLPSDRSWSPAEFMQRLDQITQSDIFARLYERYAQSSQFPDLGSAYDQLGLRSGPSGLSFADGESARALRDSIMRSAAPTP